SISTLGLTRVNRGPRPSLRGACATNPRYIQENCIVESQRFDAIVRSLSRLPSRRDILRGFIGTGIGLGTLRAEATEAKSKHHKKHRGEQSQSPPSRPSATCTPRCGRKRCGDDGCGGSCGSCAAGQFCSSGTCCTQKDKNVLCTADCGLNAPCPGRCDTVS